MKILVTLLVGVLRLPFVGGLARRALSAGRRLVAEAMKRADRDHVRPREWSNAELRRIAAHCPGPVINVSGWRDEDQRGGRYRDYFTACESYFVSNFAGTRGQSGVENELFLDLESSCSELGRRFQTVFNHTTLEHVFDIHTAIATLCALSDDLLILVTPFLQQVHFEPGAYGDYWRPTPMCLRRLLESHGFTTLYQNSNDNDWYVVYVITVASRHPDRWRDRLPSGLFADTAGLRHFGLERASGRMQAFPKADQDC